MSRVALAIVLIQFSGLARAGEKQQIPDEHIFGPLLNKIVVLDGIAFDWQKGIQGRIVLPSRHEAYITDPWKQRDDGTHEPRLPQGKLVRVIGRLSYEHLGPPPKGAQGYPGGFSYFAVEMQSFQVIERAEHAFPTAHKK